jgi:glutamate synthase (NADPH/NADH) small chain
MGYQISRWKKVILIVVYLQMEQEGVEFRTSVCVGAPGEPITGVNNLSQKFVSQDDLLKEFDAIALTGGSEVPRDLTVAGRDLNGVHFAMEFLPQQNRVVAGDRLDSQILATGKHVVVIGGGDTGSDCVGTSNRQGAASVTQFELMPMPPEQENRPLTWPEWPIKLRTSSSHEEGCSRDWSGYYKALRRRSRQSDEIDSSSVGVGKRRRRTHANARNA